MHKAVTLVALLCAGCATVQSAPVLRTDCKLPSIGATKVAALAAVAPCWSKPYFNQTITAGGAHEQAVFARVVMHDVFYSYMYFDNGKLTAIQP